MFVQGNLGVIRPGEPRALKLLAEDNRLCDGRRPGEARPGELIPLGEPSPGETSADERWSGEAWCNKELLVKVGEDISTFKPGVEGRELPGVSGWAPELLAYMLSESMDPRSMLLFFLDTSLCEMRIDSSYRLSIC
jgi:hypothetical protein